MILSRVIEHVKAQNWTAVALDFVIVVMGVFVGLQVQEWNTARSDRARGRHYLERINADLETDINNADDKIAFWKEVSALGEEGLAFAEIGAIEGRSNWDLLLAFFQASQVSEYVATTTTYDEMRSVGELGLIRDIELRRLISQYYTNAFQRAVTEYPAYREHVRGVIPTAIQSYIWTTCYNSDPDNNQQLIACASPVAEARAGEIVKAIAANEALMAELRYWISTMQVASLIADDRIEEASRNRKLINAALNASKAGRSP